MILILHIKQLYQNVAEDQSNKSILACTEHWQDFLEEIANCKNIIKNIYGKQKDKKYAQFG